MSKEDGLKEFDIDLKEFGADKYGGPFRKSILSRTRRLIINDRLGVIEALRYWLRLGDGITIIALIIITEVNIPELKPELDCLKKDIESGKAFLPDYSYLVNRALKVISENPELAP